MCIYYIKATTVSTATFFGLVTTVSYLKIACSERTENNDNHDNRFSLIFKLWTNYFFPT